MFARGGSPATRIAAVSAVVLAVAAAILLWADPDPSVRAAARPTHTARAAANGSCGTKAAANIAAVQMAVSTRIYTDELRGRETAADVGRIRAFQPLLAAVAANDPAAARRAVHTLVYTPGWHIVRLQAIRGGRLLADVGGPHILAPVSGTLRRGGRVIGRYVMSVQDDAGYVKLVTRFTGAPIEIYQHGGPLMGTIAAPSSPPADGTSVTLGGVRYRVSVLPADAFPSGSLTIALFVPFPGGAAGSCAAVRVAAWGSIARHIASRFNPLSAHLQDFASVIRAVTQGRVLVRSGSTPLLGGGPKRLPSSGHVSYAGRSWPVYSWEPVHGQRFYFLTPG